MSCSEGIIRLTKDGVCVGEVGLLEVLEHLERNNCVGFTVLISDRTPSVKFLLTTYLSDDE